MLTDILIALGIGAVIAILLYAIFASARTAQKGNAPVAEASKPKKQQQQKSEEKEEQKEEAAAATTTTASSAAAPKKKQQQQQKERVSSPSSASNASSEAGMGKKSASSASSSNNQQQASAKKGSSKADKKAAKKAREEEEAELDAIVEAEMKRSIATGIRKEKFEIINLEKLQQAKESKAQRQEKKAEGATFNEKQIAVEKAAGFRVVGAQEAAKKEAQSQQAKSSSPASREEKKAKKEALTREEELDLALRSVLSKRGNKNNKSGGGFFRPRNGEETSSPEGERGFVELKGEVKASRPGGAWGRSDE